MKEASGELSMTAIAAIAIGALALIFSTVILPLLRNSLKSQTNCANATGCTNCDANTGMCDCYYYEDENGTLSSNTIRCKKQ